MEYAPVKRRIQPGVCAGACAHTGALTTVEGGDEGDGVTVLNHVVETTFQFPITIIDQHKDSRTPVNHSHTKI